MRFPFFLFTFALLTLALAPAACSTSSNCTYPPGPPPLVTIQAPCGLVITAITVSGPCQQVSTDSMPEVEGTGSGTCNVAVTFSNDTHASGSVTFTTSSCGIIDPSSPTIDLDGGACDASPSDATAG